MTKTSGKNRQKHGGTHNFWGYFGGGGKKLYRRQPFCVGLNFLAKSEKPIRVTLQSGRIWICWLETVKHWPIYFCVAVLNHTKSPVPTMLTLKNFSNRQIQILTAFQVLTKKQCIRDSRFILSQYGASKVHIPWWSLVLVFTLTSSLMHVLWILIFSDLMKSTFASSN